METRGRALLGAVSLAIAIAITGCGSHDNGPQVATANGVHPSAPGPTASVAPTDRVEQLRVFAQCMRDHGIDMEDPVFDENGRVQIKTNGPSGGGGDPRNDEDFEAAQEACSPDGGLFGQGPAGPPDSASADGNQ